MNKKCTNIIFKKEIMNNTNNFRNKYEQHLQSLNKQNDCIVSRAPDVPIKSGSVKEIQRLFNISSHNYIQKTQSIKFIEPPTITEIQHTFIEQPIINDDVSVRELPIITEIQPPITFIEQPIMNDDVLVTIIESPIITETFEDITCIEQLIMNDDISVTFMELSTITEPLDITCIEQHKNVSVTFIEQPIINDISLIEQCISDNLVELSIDQLNNLVISDKLTFLEQPIVSFKLAINNRFVTNKNSILWSVISPHFANSYILPINKSIISDNFIRTNKLSHLVCKHPPKLDQKLPITKNYLAPCLFFFEQLRKKNVATQIIISCNNIG